MISSKYASDYRLENVADPKTGKLKTKAVYRGDWFRFEKPAELVKKRKILFTALTAVVIAAFAAALMLTGGAERNRDVKALEQIYVLLPFVGLLFPIYYLIGATVRMWSAREKVTRADKDRIEGRFTGAAVAAIVLAGVSLAGHIVSWALNGETKSDIVLLILTAAVIAAGVVMLVFRKDLAMEKCGTARISYPDEDPETTRITTAAQKPRRDMKKR